MGTAQRCTRDSEGCPSLPLVWCIYLFGPVQKFTRPRCALYLLRTFVMWHCDTWLMMVKVSHRDLRVFRNGHSVNTVSPSCVSVV